MNKFIAALAVAASGFAPICAVPANAQMAPPIVQIGVDNFGTPICNGPQGVAPCAVIMNWLQNGGMQQMQMPRPMPQPQGGGFGMGPIGPAGVPTNIVPRDGQMVGMIAQQCGGNPACIAGAWANVEIQRCAQGIGVSGGCFGPNGEIVKAIRTISHDLTHGAGENNDAVGRNGWVCKKVVSIFSRC